MSTAARLLRLWVRIPLRAWMFVWCECCVLSGRGLCDGLITRPEESYRMWRVVVCDHETSRMRRLKPATGLWKYNHSGLYRQEKNPIKFGRQTTANSYYVPFQCCAPHDDPSRRLRRDTFVRSIPTTRWFKYDRDWFVCKQAALRSSCATLTVWSHKLHPPSCSG